MTQDPPIAVGAVGCGGFATNTHLPNLATLPAYHLHAAVDVDAARAQHVAEQYGLAYATTEYARLLEDLVVQLVVITTPHDEHAAMAIAAARAGKHILLEKPMAMIPEETTAVVHAVRDAGVTFAIGFNRRFAPLSQRLAALLAGHHQPWMLRNRMVDAVWTRFRLSYADVAELLVERGIHGDPSTIYAWVLQFTPLYQEVARSHRHLVGRRWAVDETSIRVAGVWCYADRVLDEHDQGIDVYVSPTRDQAAATAFFRQALGETDATPHLVTTDKAAPYLPALAEVLPSRVHLRGKSSQQRIERDH